MVKAPRYPIAKFRRIPPGQQGRTMAKLAHPYNGFEGSILYKRVDRAILELAKNGDIRVTTRREYVVGYICRALTQAKRR